VPSAANPVVLHLEHEQSIGTTYADHQRTSAGVLADVPDRLRKHGLHQRLQRGRHLGHRPVHVEVDVEPLPRESLELSSECRPGRAGRSTERALKRRTEVAQGDLELIGASLARRIIERSLW
jgi:hypothetical protein